MVLVTVTVTSSWRYVYLMSLFRKGSQRIVSANEWLGEDRQGGNGNNYGHK